METAHHFSEENVRASLGAWHRQIAFSLEASDTAWNPTGEDFSGPGEVHYYDTPSFGMRAHIEELEEGDEGSPLQAFDDDCSGYNADTYQELS